MKRKFTKLMAALALLLLIAPPMVGWGQTYNLATSLSIDDQVIMVNTGFTKELTGITTSGTTYGIATNISNSSLSGTYILTVVAGNSSGSYAFKTSDNKYLSWSSGNSLTTTTSVTNASSWTVQINSDGDATVVNVGTTTRYLQYNSSSPRFACYTNSQQEVRFYKKEDTGPTCTITPTEWDFGNVQAGSSEQTKEFNVTTANLTSDLTVELLEGNYYSVDVTSIGQTETSKTITVTLDPTAVGTMEDVLKITGDGVEDIEVDLTATGLCNTNPLAFTTPVNLQLTGNDVEYTLIPTTNGNNSANITYEVTQGDVTHGEVIDGVFIADAWGYMGCYRHSSCLRHYLQWHF